MPSRAQRGNLPPPILETAMPAVNIRQLSTAAADFEAEFARLRHWSAATDDAIEQRVAQIVADVRARGDAAVLDCTARLDGLHAPSVAALELSRDELQRAFEPKMQIFFQQKSTLGFITTQQRLLSFLTMNIQERYEIVLKNQFDLCNRISKTLLASYLGVSRETLSRLHPKK